MYPFINLNGSSLRIKDDLMKSLEELDGSKILDVAGDTVGDYFNALISGGKKK